jgi:cyclic pyranopterin phosphate synthase
VTGQPFPHLDSSGAAHMVDVGAKSETDRQAVARGRVLLQAGTLAALRSGSLPKGDALAVARIAGIMGAKRTPDLIPLCHPIRLSAVRVDVEVGPDAVLIECEVRTTDRTGVEMEALTAVSVAALSVVDMVKAMDPGATVSDIRVVSKRGGATGEWLRPAGPGVS